MDIVKPLPPSKSDILVVATTLQDWWRPFGIPSHDAVTVANCIVNSAFCRWGVPSQIHSDMGAQFESDCKRIIRKILCINKYTQLPTIHNATG